MQPSSNGPTAGIQELWSAVTGLMHICMMFLRFSLALSALAAPPTMTTFLMTAGIHQIQLD